MDLPRVNDQDAIISPALHPLAIGEINEGLQPPQETLRVLSILTDAGIQCCFVQEQALIYYGTARVPRVRADPLPCENQNERHLTIIPGPSAMHTGRAIRTRGRAFHLSPRYSRALWPKSPQIAEFAEPQVS